MLKYSRREILGGFQKHFLKINLLLMKKAVLHTATPMHYKTRQVLRDLLVC